jgi:SAM-dependent methyltransferase
MLQETAVCHTGSRDRLQVWLKSGYNKLNIGGGPKNLSGFVNLDFVAFAGVERQVIADIRDLSFIPDGTISHIHSNHVIEHLSPEELHIQLTQWYRVLKEEGIVSIRCPNALGVAFGFWFPPVSEEARAEFLRLGYPADEDFCTADGWMHKDVFGTLYWFYADPGNIRNQHLSIVTPSILKTGLERAGFQIARMSAPESVNLVVVAAKGKAVKTESGGG